MSYRREPRIHDATWIVAADRAKARIFRSQWPELGQCEAIHEMQHAASRGRPDGDPDVVDGPGIELPSEAKHAEAQHFACEIRDVLESGRKNNEFGRLIIIADPMFLGVLRGKASPALEKTIAGDINKNLTSMDVETILEAARQVALDATGQLVDS